MIQSAEEGVMTTHLKEKHTLVTRWAHWINFPVLGVMIWSGLLIYWANTAVVIYAQAPPSGKSKSDAEKITSAVQAGPKFVTRKATVLDWPNFARRRVPGWTCLPGFPRAPHDEPGCFDQVFLQFIKDSMAGRTPNVQSVGISYMYGGFWVPNKSPAIGTGDEFHVGPHIMIIGPDQKMLETLNHDGSNGEPYVNHLPGRTELFLVIPIREWDDAQAVRTVGAAHR